MSALWNVLFLYLFNMFEIIPKVKVKKPQHKTSEKTHLANVEISVNC